MRARAISILTSILMAAATGFLPGQALAQSGSAASTAEKTVSAPIGKVVSVSGSVTIEHVNAVVVQANLGGQLPRTKAEDPVYLGDIVQSGADGKVAIVFTDGTTFNLSSNARMVLNEFVYDPKGQSNSTLFSLTKGTFTFVAGQVAKTGSMKVDTPVATMGIRGTTPRVEIAGDGTVKFSTLIEEGKSEMTKKLKNVRYQASSKSPSCQPLPATGSKTRQTQSRHLSRLLKPLLRRG